MASHDPESELTEPVIVPDLIVNGVVVTGSPHVVRFVGWVLSPVPSQTTDERRIIVRFVMPIDAARKVAQDLAALSKREH